MAPAPRPPHLAPLHPLPIDPLKGAFQDAISAGPAVVTAPTGSGKSTRLPRWMAEQHTGPGPVVVVEPRRVACRSLAARLASEDGERVGATYGYAVRFDTKRSKDTRVLFVTPGVALRMLASGALAAGAVLVDEFHERSWQLDLLVTALRTAAEPPALFALTSATLATARVAAWLDAPVLTGHGRPFPVDITHAPGAPATPSAQDLDRRMAAAIHDALAHDAGDVLCFLPGVREIQHVERALGRLPASVRVCPLHGRQSPSEARRALEPGDGRRVILATNVAETSLTVPGVTCVIDSGLVRRTVHRAGRTVLALVQTSQAERAQRAGRAGRERPGRCVRLYGPDPSAPQDTPPEILRTELDDFVVAAARLDLSGDALAHAPFLDAPPAFALERAVTRLTTHGVLAPNGLTALGDAVSRLPVAIADALLLVDPPAEIAADVADVVAVLSGPPPRLVQPGRQTRTRHSRDDVDLARERVLGRAGSDVEEAVLLLRQAAPGPLGQDPRAHQSARHRATQLRKLVGAPPLAAADPKARVGTEAVAAHMARRLPAAAFARRPRADKPRKPGRGPGSALEPWGNGDMELDVLPYTPPGADGPCRPAFGLVLASSWHTAKRGTGARGRARLLLPAPADVLLAAGVGDAVQGAVRVAKKRPLRLAATTTVSLGGRPLGERETRPCGPALCAALATLVLADRAFAPAGDAARAHVFYVNLLAGWDRDAPVELPAQPEPITDPAAWLAAHLEDLGVEQQADLDLLDADDIVPDLASTLGVSAWALEPLCAAFSPRFVHQGGQYDVRVHPARRTVDLVAADKKAMGQKTIPLHVLPRYMGFKVAHVRVSRRTMLRG